MPADGMPVAIEISKRELRHVQLATHKSLYRFSIPQHMSRPKSLSQFYRGQSDLAAARARAQAVAAWYRAITATDPPKHKPHRRR
jgi:hypothetical protein